MMEKLYKPFVEWVTKWKHNIEGDEFLSARLKLTGLYFLTALIILVIASVFLYHTLLVNLEDSVSDTALNPRIAHSILDKAEDGLQARFILVDSAILLLVLYGGFILTYKTLAPIRENMQRQKRFIADASHELRTPLAVAISSLEVGLRNKEMGKEEARSVLNQVLEEMREMTLLCNQLLDISKEDTYSGAHHQPVNIYELVEEILQKMKPLAEEKELALLSEITEDQYVIGDALQLKRVLYNILTNSFEHTPKGGRISFQGRLVGTRYEVSMTDTGVGMSLEVLKHIFDPFFRGDASRHTPGAGLGLALCQKIMKSHKGEIRVESIVGQGTTIVLVFPFESKSISS